MELKPTQRNRAVDIYRGFVMFLMMAEILEFSKVSKAIPESKFWSFLAFHQSHVEWVGCSLHDLIQPSFTFLVGVALPFSIASRMSKGAGFKSLMLHTIKRSLILILLGIFLRSVDRNMTNWTFEDTLTQIGLGYTFLFLIGFLKPKMQWVTLAVILVGYWLAFALYSPPKVDFYLLGEDSQPQPYLSVLAAHWNKFTNLAAAFYCWFFISLIKIIKYLFRISGY